jgi:protein gp37
MTWNPIKGCTKVSEGCRHCYAERMALRLRAIERWGGKRKCKTGRQLEGRTYDELPVFLP